MRFFSQHSLAALTLVALWPTLAWASGGGGDTGLESILVLLAVVTVAYLVTHVASDWLQKRYGFVTGVEYIVLGAVVGPWFGLLAQESVNQFIPAMVLGTGSLGLLTGLQLNIQRLIRKRPPALGTGAAISLGTLVVLGGVAIVLLLYLQPDSWTDYIPHVLALVAVALVADQALVRTLVAFLHARGAGVSYLLRAARVSSSIAVLVFGMLFSVGRSNTEFFGYAFTGAQAGVMWFLGHLVIGTVLGLIFAAFLVRDYEDEKILTVVIGMVIFTSGFAFYLELSPIVVNFVLGFVLSNTSKQSAHVEAMLLSVERPLYIVLFFFAGAQMSFDVPWWGYTLFFPYLALRAAGRSLGGLVAARGTRAGREFPPLGLSLLAPGALSVAMALDYHEVHGTTSTGQLVYLTIITGVIVSEVVAYRSTRRWLIDATEVSTDSEGLVSTGEAA